MNYARHFALFTMQRLPIHVEADDLKGEAVLALVTVGAKFDPTRGLPFAGVAKIRIRGALSDYLRKHDPMRTADLEDVHLVEHDFTESVTKAAELVRAALLDLPERERGILIMRECYGLKHKRIAEEVSLSTARIWQLHRWAKDELKRALARRGIRKVADIL